MKIAELNLTNIDFSEDGLQDEIWWEMCDRNMSRPEPLTASGIASFNLGWVYLRKYGLFCVTRIHPFAMAQLLAWENGYMDFMEEDFLQKIGIESADAYDLQDKFLELLDGACFQSSVSKKVQCWSPDKLNISERRIIGERNIRYLNDES